MGDHKGRLGAVNLGPFVGVDDRLPVHSRYRVDIRTLSESTTFVHATAEGILMFRLASNINRKTPTTGLIAKVLSNFYLFTIHSLNSI